MAIQIVIPKDKKEMMLEELARQDYIPLRIKCPECGRIYVLYVKDFDTGMHVLLGQACPYCKRFIKESDTPEDLLVDAKEIAEMMTENGEATKMRGAKVYTIIPEEKK